MVDRQHPSLSVIHQCKLLDISRSGLYYQPAGTSQEDVTLMKLTSPNIPMARGFLYLVVIMDWYSRYVLAWRLSNTLDAGFCVETLEEAMKKGRPDIFNTDQGAQFTSEAFTGLLEQHEVRISMDGKGRYSDNLFIERLWRTVKYEETCYEKSIP